MNSDNINSRSSRSSPHIRFLRQNTSSPPGAEVIHKRSCNITLSNQSNKLLYLPTYCISESNLLTLAIPKKQRKIKQNNSLDPNIKLLTNNSHNSIS